MALNYLDVKGITQTRELFKTKVTDFNDAVKEMDSATLEALKDWGGKGRTQFEIQMKLMKSQLDDISDMLIEIYNALVKAEQAYIDADEEVAKAESSSIKN